MKGTLQRRDVNPQGTKESRASQAKAKAMEEVKTLEVQPRRTPRRRGGGMLGQEAVAQGRSHGGGGSHPSSPLVEADGEVRGEAP